MTRGGFDANLQILNNEIERLGGLVEIQIHQAVDALVKQNEAMADTVIKNDDLVDNLQKEIEDKSIKLIAMQQPLATDLRNIFTSVKVAADLERMADHAVDIAKIAKRLKDEVYIKELVDIPRMAQIVEILIRESINAYTEANLEKAHKSCKIDDEIDAIFKKVFTELLTYMTKEAKNLSQVAQFLFVARHLERVADYATNICEYTIYLVTGEHVDLNE
jgi:phosphate transport system protein